MASIEGRKFDIVLFGASGFTGSYVLERLCEIGQEVTWAVGGRSRTKLQQALSVAGARTSFDTSSVSVLEADVNDPTAVAALCRQARVVISAVGPYRKYGEPVLRACVEAGTSYVDVCGEPQFLDQMFVRYDSLARETGAVVVGACGFDSIPAEFGVNYAKSIAKGEVVGVEGFLDITTGPAGGSANTGTWESAVLGISNASQLTKLRAQIFTDKSARPKQKIPKRGLVSHVSELGRWCIPLPSADASVVRRTQYYNYTQREEPMAQLVTYFLCGSRLSAWLGILMAVFFGIMCQFRCGRYLLLKFPSFFSGGLFKSTGPTREQVAGTRFSFTFLCRVLDEQQKPLEPLKVVCRGPEPGYAATSAMLLCSALVLLQEKQQLPKTGGVYSPGVVFRDTRLLQRIEKYGITFRTA